MYAYISGKLTKATPLYVIIELSGVGYQVYIPASAHAKLPQLGEQLHLFTCFVVRELSQTLYGFISEQEKEIFEVLLAISGIGPKIALSILGHLSPVELCDAVANHDTKSICKVPGIGRKSAERLMIEVKDKLAAMAPDSPSRFAVDLNGGKHADLVQDAMSALINLGYNQAVAKKAIKKTLESVSDATDLAQLIMLSLKNV
ncbi:MAG: Holliday junction branch migration protein RuvA [Chlamydiota bacterium]|nr:Holliday junction branch migration protein RuvA [Chlamydiota bacterium]